MPLTLQIYYSSISKTPEKTWTMKNASIFLFKRQMCNKLLSDSSGGKLIHKNMKIFIFRVFYEVFKRIYLNWCVNSTHFINLHYADLSSTKEMFINSQRSVYFSRKIYQQTIMKSNRKYQQTNQKNWVFMIDIDTIGKEW